MAETVLTRFQRWLRRLRRTGLVLLIIAGVLLVVRIALPSIIESQINKRLNAMPGYTGHVENIDLQLFRGAYRLENLVIDRKDGATVEPFLAVGLIDFSLAWRELFHGKFVSDIALDEVVVKITRTPAPPRDVKEEGGKWQDLVNDLFPIEITRVRITHSEVRFVDRTSEPVVDLALTNLYAEILGLRNKSEPGSSPYPTTGRLQALTVGDGRLDIWLNADPLAPQPHFKLKVELADVSLPAVNDFLQAYANVDVSSGILQVALEFNAAEGRFEGYVKPLIANANFKNVEDREKGVFRRMREAVVGAIASILKNSDTDKVGTRVPFSGEFGKTDVGVWATIVNLLRNGFGTALTQGVDGELPSADKEKPKPKPSS